MTGREQEILELIKQNPLISQKELANTLNITRSSVGVHITNLIKKGYIQGKGYVINKSNYVTVLGAANLDIHGFTEKELIANDSNPGEIKICLGGVGRNIAENVARMGIETKLITATGGDSNSKRLLTECTQIGIDMQHTLVLADSNASIYLAIMDDCGDMALALSDMHIMDRITIEYIQSKSHVLKNSAVIVLDTCLPTNVIEYILNNYRDKEILLDPVSIRKSRKIKHLIGGFHTIKLNRLEAQDLSDITIDTDDDIIKVANYFIAKGVKRVFITLGKNGVFYSDGHDSGYIKPPNIKVVNATGAGDAFMAGIVYGSIHNKSIKDIAIHSTAASVIALKNHETVSPNMNELQINQIVEEMIK